MSTVKFVSVISLLTLFFFNNVSLAADVAKIGVLDLQKILETSIAGKSIQAQLKKQKDQMESDLKQKGSEIEKISKRLATLRAEDEGRGRRNLEAIAQAVLPGGKPQERVTNIFEFLGRYGRSFLDLALKRLDPWTNAHSLVEIAPAGVDRTGSQEAPRNAQPKNEGEPT